MYVATCLIADHPEPSETHPSLLSVSFVSAARNQALTASSSKFAARNFVAASTPERRPARLRYERRSGCHGGRTMWPASTTNPDFETSPFPCEQSNLHAKSHLLVRVASKGDEATQRHSFMESGNASLSIGLQMGGSRRLRVHRMKGRLRPHAETSMRTVKAGASMRRHLQLHAIEPSYRTIITPGPHLGKSSTSRCYGLPRHIASMTCSGRSLRPEPVQYSRHLASAVH